MGNRREGGKDSRDDYRRREVLSHRHSNAANRYKKVPKIVELLENPRGRYEGSFGGRWSRQQEITWRGKLGVNVGGSG